MKSLSKDFLGDFGKTLKKIDLESCDSLSQHKSSLIKHLKKKISDRKSDVNIISTTPTARAYERIVTSLDQNEDFLLNFDKVKLCTSQCKIRNPVKQDLSVFQTKVQSKNKIKRSLNDVIKNYLYPSGKCGVCSKPKQFKINCENPPIIIAFDVTPNLIQAAENIKLLEIDYTLFAVAYNKDNHFMALIKFNGKILEYDGLTDDGRLSYHNKDKFSSFLDNVKDKAVMYWYRRLII